MNLEPADYESVALTCCAIGANFLHSVFIEACDSHHNDGYIRETTSHDANTSIHLVVTNTITYLRNNIKILDFSRTTCLQNK